MGSPAASLQLDHLVVLLSHEQLQYPPAWLTENFTVVPGGRHADGLTENKLIIFQDGSYIELIAFLPSAPASASQHRWSGLALGPITYALTLPPSSSTTLSTLLTSNPTLQRTYSAPTPGGRRRPRPTPNDPNAADDIHWQTSFPHPGPASSALPFFCVDVDADGEGRNPDHRRRRVPVEPAGTQHPCGATGIAELVVRVPAARFGEARELYGALLGPEARAGSARSAEWVLGGGTPEGERRWAGARVVLVQGAEEEGDAWLSEVAVRVGREGVEWGVSEGFEEGGREVEVWFRPEEDEGGDEEEEGEEIDESEFGAVLGGGR